mmetsp:Transcript_11836/g.29178  ORF Transcript_11836/g.29178 Transcript_11836/m.29178 type:complete len:288 (-) Transcript_11836:423-1286(-)
MMEMSFIDLAALLKKKQDNAKMINERLGKESYFNNNCDLFTGVSQRGSKSFKFHVISKLSEAGTIISKIENIGDKLKLQKVIIEKAIEIVSSCAKKFKIKNKTTFAVSTLFYSCQLNKYPLYVDDFIKIISGLKKREIYRIIKEIKLIVTQKIIEQETSIKMNSERIIFETRDVIFLSKIHIIMLNKISAWLDHYKTYMSAGLSGWTNRNSITYAYAILSLVYVSHSDNKLNVQKQLYFIFNNANIKIHRVKHCLSEIIKPVLKNFKSIFKQPTKLLYYNIKLVFSK